MHNFYIIIMSSLITLQLASNALISNKIDNTLNLINAELVALSITEKSKLEAYNNNDLSYLAIDHTLFSYMVENILSKNIPNIEHSVEYYYYDNQTYKMCEIGEFYCNSVQLRISLTISGKKYSGEMRYEPIEA